MQNYNFFPPKSCLVQRTVFVNRNNYSTFNSNLKVQTYTNACCQHTEVRNARVRLSSGVRGYCKTTLFYSTLAFPALEPRLPWKPVLSQAGESCWAALTAVEQTPSPAPSEIHIHPTVLDATIRTVHGLAEKFWPERSQILF